MRDPDKKKTISNEVIFNVIGIVGVILLVPIFITFVFWYLDTNVLQQVDENFLNTFVSHSKEILIISVSLYALAFYYVVTFFRTVKPKKTDMLASQCWSTVSEQKNFFGSTVVDASLNLEHDQGQRHQKYLQALRGAGSHYGEKTRHDLCRA